MSINPLFLMVPVTLICSFAFRFPAGTPPNAIITVAGGLPIRSLMLGGCLPGLYSLLVVLILFPTWGAWIYDAYTVAPWLDNHYLHRENTSDCKESK